MYYDHDEKKGSSYSFIVPEPKITIVFKLDALTLFFDFLLNAGRHMDKRTMNSATTVETTTDNIVARDS